MKIARNGKVIVIAVLGLVLCYAASVKADFVFGTPKNLGPKVNSSNPEYDPSISADGLELYFQSTRVGGYGDRDIYVATRATTSDEWSQAVNLGPVINTADRDAGPEISSDGLSLYFNSNRPGGYGNYDLYVTTRKSVGEPWAEPVNLGSVVNSWADDISPSISADGLSLFFSDGDALGTVARADSYGGADIWVARRQSMSEPWGIPVSIDADINMSFIAGAPEISADGLTLLFSGYLPNGGTNDLWMVVRDNMDAPWSSPVNLGPVVNSDVDADLNPSLSADGRTLYFSSFRSGGSGSADLWQVQIEPVVDLNRDGMVDRADLDIMLERWHTNDPLCDIGPTPFGDGIVDSKDMVVLAGHLFQEVLPPELIAYWKLDETEGDVACDCTGRYDGVLGGGPQWQPAAGRISGALEFDGIDDYVCTDTVLDPSEGSFCAFAWIKGGRPGEVIVSQSDGVGSGETWLGIESSTGALMTALIPQPGRSIPQPLVSDTIITDGRWHHIAVVWDTTYRHLYVDGALVAEDTVSPGSGPLKSANGGLNIGTGKTLEAGSFFSGMIDDVRIYDGVRGPMQIEALANRGQ